MKSVVLAVIFVAAFVSVSLTSSAQYEVNGGLTTSKQKSNYSNYNSKYRPPAWWVELWRFAKWITGNGSNAVENDEVYKPRTRAFSTENLSWGVGLGLGNKGAKFTYPGGKTTISILYLQIPVVAKYDFDLNENLGAFAALGPYYAVALGGKSKWEDGKEDLNFGSGDGDDLRRGDYGIKFRIGCALKNKPITIGIHGDLGLRNLSPDGDDDFKIKNQTFGIQVGYIFNSFK